MKKFPVIQKVQLDVCGICEAELFYGAGEFKTLEAEENFYDFLENQTWAYEGWDSDADYIPYEDTFCCDMCKTHDLQIKHEIFAARIINADKFEDFISSAKICAEYINDEWNEWVSLRDHLRNNLSAKNHILYHSSRVLGEEEGFLEEASGYIDDYDPSEGNF